MGRKKKIIIVEDEWLVADDLQNTLIDFGYEVSSIVQSGEEVLINAKKENPDLIIMDIKLRGKMDGIETAMNLKKNNCDVPIIFLTAYSDEKLLTRIMTSEPYGYLNKPYKANELHTSIQIAIHKHRAAMESLKTNTKSRTIKSAESAYKKFDSIDQQILELLIQDGRKKLIEISRKIGSNGDQSFSDVGVKKRLAKLTSNEIIKIQANISLKKLGYIAAIMLLETETNNTADIIIQKFLNCPRILFGFKTSGKFDLIYGIYANDIYSLDYFISGCSPKFHPGIRDSRVFISSEIIYPQFFPISHHMTKTTDQCAAGYICKECRLFENNKCRGCNTLFVDN